MAVMYPKRDNADGIIDAAINNFGQLDILVNNAGVVEFVSIDDFSEEIYQKTFSVNVLGSFLVTAAALKHLKEGASIINISSSVTEWAPPHSSVYAASKGAVDAFTAVLANELGPKKIRVNAIKPETIVTEKVEAAGDHVAEFLKTLLAQTPIGRFGRPEDIGKVAVFLASEASCYVSGAHLSASGGFHAV